MKKAVIILSILFTLVFIVLIVIIIFLFSQMQTQQMQPMQQAQQNVQQTPPAQHEEELTESLAAELADLRAQLQELLNNDDSIISESEAEIVALDFLGFGAISHTMLFIGDGLYTFEVEIMHEMVRYIVYVNAVEGTVLRMARFDENIYDITE
ncbi:MAG: PepSY domain-containing protein [Firmicutes bacterium]|nr:PepSY domain-containing protein [Bacillota bacterium]